MPRPVFVWLPTKDRAYSWSPAAPVLKMAHCPELKSFAKPMCWFWALKSATNSSVRPGAKNASVRTKSSSSTTLPELTTAGGPAFQSLAVQPAGRLLPPNSAPTVGARMTSPPDSSAR